MEDQSVGLHPTLQEIHLLSSLLLLLLLLLL
jgi:hypothetical protein